MYKQNLRTFLAVCETNSFSKAAARLYITPSAVIQQINALEHDLKVTLFNRNQKGVTLTDAGKYLETEGKEYVKKSEDIRHALLNIADRTNEICVGTSLMEKCRVLCDLWIMFSRETDHFEIKMLNIDTGHAIPEKTDLIESISCNAEWSRDWNFLEISQVSFGIAMRTDHPLAAKAVIHPEDLRGERVMSINRGSCETIRKMLSQLGQNGAEMIYTDDSHSSMLWECSFHNYLSLVPVCWTDTLINLSVRPLSWDYRLPYGFFYRQKPSDAAVQFLDFVRKTCSEENTKFLFTAGMHACCASAAGNVPQAQFSGPSRCGL